MYLLKNASLHPKIVLLCIYFTSNFITCQLHLDDKFSTRTRYLVLVGGPYLKRNTEIPQELEKNLHRKCTNTLTCLTRRVFVVFHALFHYLGSHRDGHHIHTDHFHEVYLWLVPREHERPATFDHPNFLLHLPNPDSPRSPVQTTTMAYLCSTVIISFNSDTTQYLDSPRTQTCLSYLFCQFCRICERSLPHLFHGSRQVYLPSRFVLAYQC